jgi:hypothetical protein
MLKEIFLSARTSVGIWKVAPPILLLRTSTAGVTLANAFFHISYPSSPVMLYFINSIVKNLIAVLFLPSHIKLFIKRVTILSLKRGSGANGKFLACALRMLLIFKFI